jgi:uncharacterized membrane protein YcaP (DUF421 family)
MDTVIRAACIYFVLLIILRFAAGRRTLAQATPFDLVLLLIISETIQQAFIDGEDSSVTSALIAIVTLVGIDVLLAQVKSKWHGLAKFLDGSPMVLVENGKLLETRMRYSRVDEDEIMEAARSLHGLTSLDQIKYAILETSGEISVVPKNRRN